MRTIWSPRVNFVGSIGQKTSLVDDKCVAFIERASLRETGHGEKPEEANRYSLDNTLLEKTECEKDFGVLVNPELKPRKQYIIARNRTDRAFGFITRMVTNKIAEFLCFPRLLCLVVHGNTSGSPRDIKLPTIVVEIFSGRESALWLVREYQTIFSCDFDLLMYPFDKQLCSMKLMLTSASSEYLTFDGSNSQVEYTGSRSLLEYHIDNIVLEVNNASELAQLTITVKVSRLSGYVVLTIFIPTTTLLVITYLTLFFRPDIFEVRVMTSLTALLVMAALFTQASSSLPSTSYFKMIDIWLLFCTLLIFVIIALHTFLDRRVPPLGSVRLPDPIINKDSFTHMSANTVRSSKTLTSGKMRVVPSYNAKQQNKGIKCLCKVDTNQSDSLVVWVRCLVAFLVVVFNVAFWSVALQG
ncbi:glutamate-gated chloride channel alpha-like [Oratosquilla oratoria]|uniref:glutamate-gated chloride channel alpha-like n=1 Tax=Oratosquilla oratoria TaxID=337810 RepID=UPI003F76F452